MIEIVHGPGWVARCKSLFPASKTVDLDFCGQTGSLTDIEKRSQCQNFDIKKQHRRVHFFCSPSIYSREAGQSYTLFLGKK
jgi:hypothetical protein